MNSIKRTTLRFFPLVVLFFGWSIVNAQIKSKDSLLSQIRVHQNRDAAGTQQIVYVDLLNELAKKYRYRHADSLNLLSNEALTISSKIKYSKGKALALLRKGDYYSDIGQIEKAFENYEKSKRIAFSLNNPEIKVEVLKSIAFQEFTSQNLKNAVLHFYEAIELASVHNLTELEARLRHNLGYCYSSYKLFDEAQIEYLVADSLWILISSDTPLRSMTVTNIGLNAIEKGDLDLGKKYNDMSIDLLKKSNDFLWLSRAYRVDARYYLKQNQFSIAINSIRKSDSILSLLYNPRDQMEIDLIHSTILTKLRELKSAKEYSLKSLKTALNFKDTLFQVKSYENLEKIEELHGRTDSAYTYYKKKKKIKSLLDEGKKVQNIALLRAKMNFDNEKEALQLENLKDTLTKEKYFQWATVALLASIIIAFVLYKSSSKEKKLNKILEEKSKILLASETNLKMINSNQKTLFSIVAHDLRGPMNSLRGLLRVMSSEEDKKIFTKNLLPKLNKYTDHVHFTLDNLLNWGNNQIKGENLKPSTLNIQAIASEVVSLYSESILKKELSVKLSIDKNINAWADKEDVNVVLRNLLSNAIKFSHKGGQIKLTGKYDNEKVIIEVQDKGIGMSNETQKLVCDLDTLFTTFGTNNEKGTGLGLMLCKEVVARNNGLIKVDSVEGKGTKFSVFLPKSKEV